MRVQCVSSGHLVCSDKIVVRDLEERDLQFNGANHFGNWSTDGDREEQVAVCNK